MSKPHWLGKDVVGGVPSEPRPDRRPPDHWRLEDVFATARPHHPALSSDGARIAFVLDIEGTTDIWAIDVDGGGLTRITTNRGLGRLLGRQRAGVVTRWCPDRLQQRRGSAHRPRRGRAVTSPARRRRPVPGSTMIDYPSSWSVRAVRAWQLSTSTTRGPLPSGPTTEMWERLRWRQMDESSSPSTQRMTSAATTSSSSIPTVPGRP